MKAPMILPDSRTVTIQTPRGSIQSKMGFFVPIFCGSCGIEGGMVSEENMTFAFWLCNECFAKHGETTNLYVMPDEVFWEEVKQAQLAKHGRSLNTEETLVALADPESLESKLARSRAALTPKAGA